MSLVMRCRSEEGNANLWDVSKKMFSVFFFCIQEIQTHRVTTVMVARRGSFQVAAAVWGVCMAARG